MCHGTNEPILRSVDLSSGVPTRALRLATLSAMVSTSMLLSRKPQ